MELLATLASGMVPHTPVAPAITAADATIIAILSATGRLTGLSHASEALNTGCVALPGHLATSGSLSGNITAQSHHTTGSPVVLMVLTASCSIGGFFLPLPSESIVIGLASWFIASSPGVVVPLWAMFLAAGVRAMLGDSSTFFLGTRIPVEEIPFLNWGRGETAYGLTRHTLYRRDTSFILAARFTPGGRIAVNICAGATNFDYARFLRMDFITVMYWMAHGMTIGATSGRVASGVRPLLAIAVGIIDGLMLNLMMDRSVSWVQKRFWDKSASDSSGL